MRNTSGSKGNQAMKSGQLINMRDIFVEKSYTKCAVETIPRPLSKKPKLKSNLSFKSNKNIQVLGLT